MSKKKETQEQGQEAKFPKSQLLEAKRYSPAEKAVLAAILPAEQSYSHSEAQEALDSYLKKEVM